MNHKNWVCLGPDILKVLKIHPSSIYPVTFVEKRTGTCLTYMVQIRKFNLLGTSYPAITCAMAYWQGEHIPATVFHKRPCVSHPPMVALRT